MNEIYNKELSAETIILLIIMLFVLIILFIIVFIGSSDFLKRIMLFKEIGSWIIGDVILVNEDSCIYKEAKNNSSYLCNSTLVFIKKRSDSLLFKCKNPSKSNDFIFEVKKNKFINACDFEIINKTKKEREIKMKNDLMNIYSDVYDHI